MKNKLIFWVGWLYGRIYLISEGTYFRKYGFSINEGGVPPCLHMTWWPIKDFLFHLRTRKYRIVFGPGFEEEYKGIKAVS